MTRYRYRPDAGIGIVQAQMLVSVSVLVSTIKIFSIVIAAGPELGICIGIDFKNKNI